MNRTGTIDSNAHQNMSPWLAYNLADVNCCKRMSEISHALWVMNLKETWGIFWRIPYWWHRGKEPINHHTK